MLLLNKKEILEIKKILKKENTHIDRIAFCYVDAEKQKRAVYASSFYSVPDGEMFKYSDLFRKALSGTVGKNLNTLDFSLDEEMNGTRHKELLALLDSGLKNKSLLESFYDEVISHYFHAGNYLILLAHGTYDVPGRDSNQAEMFDASDYVYQFMECVICPVDLSKPGLCYDADSSSFVEHIQEWMVGMPECGFLFPAFNDRNADIHSLLYYAGNPEELHPEMTEILLGCAEPVSAKDQKNDFNAAVEEAFGGSCSFQTVKEIHENLNRMIEENRDEPDPLVLRKEDVRKILLESGAEDTVLERIETRFVDQNNTGEPSGYMASNIASTRRFEVKTPELSVQILADRTDLIDTMMIGGQECLVIPLSNDVTVNGISIRPGQSTEGR